LLSFLLFFLIRFLANGRAYTNILTAADPTPTLAFKGTLSRALSGVSDRCRCRSDAAVDGAVDRMRAGEGEGEGRRGTL